MRIILSADSLRKPLTGIGYYTRNLANALLRGQQLDMIEGLIDGQILSHDELKELITSLDRKSSTPASTNQDLRDKLTQAARGFPGAYELRQMARRLRCKKSLASKQGFLLHETNYIPCSFSLPTVMTVHDLSHMRYPAFHPRERVAYLNKHLPKALGSASHIIVDAESTRRELLEHDPLAESKITAVPLGVSNDFHPRPEESCGNLLNRLNLGYRQFFLSVGTLEPRKNIERLLQAYDALPTELRKSFPLVLTGGKGWRDELIQERIQQISSPGRVILTGYMPQDELLQLYASAAVFVYPSLYEGFGLPVLEGMASGTPVITSNVSSMPEVAGDAALLIDPESVDDIAGAMERIAQDTALAQSLALRGLERARLFTWDRCAEQTLEVYRRVGG